MRRYIFGSLSLSSCYVFSDALWYRPLPDSRTDDNGPNHALHTYVTKKSLSDMNKDDIPLSIRTLRTVITFFSINIFRCYMYSAGDVIIINDNRYRNFVSKVISRKNGQSLITVSNHRSIFDDPGLYSTLLPYCMSIQNRYLRWSICSQEYCFNHRVSGLFSSHSLTHLMFVSSSLRLYTVFVDYFKSYQSFVGQVMLIMSLF
jgi:hypothetical protein